MKQILNYSQKSELELIEMHKSDSHWKIKQQIETYLYKKYNPLCRSFSQKFASISSFEDNMQECYMILLDAIDYVNPTKVYSSNFSFGVIYKLYLSSYFHNQTYYESYKAKCKKDEISLYYNSEDCEEMIEIKVPSHENNTIFNSIFKEFKDTLKDIEITIWDLLEEGKTQRDIAKEFNKSSIQYKVSQLKSKYIHFMNTHGYEINF